MKKNYSICLVDDNADDHFIFRAVLKKINVPCLLTSLQSGTELLDLLLKRHDYTGNTLENPDLIILDLNMPELNGFDTIREIKSRSKINNIPVYIMSISTDIKDSKKALDMGAKGFYSKPHSPGKLHQIIVEMLITL